MTNLSEIIQRLRPDNAFSLEGESLAGLSWLGDPPTEVTQSEVDEMRVAIDSEKSAVEYRGKRSAEYPSVGDQLDDLFKQGAFSAEMAAKIQAVKDKYPKPA